jgi:serine/threonine protein kinase
MSTILEPTLCPKCGRPIPSEAPQGLCPKCLLQQASIPTEIGGGEPAKSAPPTPEELAAAFPQLEILEFIGQGGMGFVFKARQPKLDRFVALKILPASLAADPAFAERFSREGRVLAKLNHPNIVTIHDFGQAGGFFYLLMEFVDGVNLRQAMNVGRFTPAQALSVVPQICDALQFAHNEGILHRDIKPENILLDSKGRVKIADFGIAKLVGAEPVTRPSDFLSPSDRERAGAMGAPASAALTETGKVLGTPHYMAPEQLEHPQDVDQRADIYSLGVVFYEMLTGELPLGRFAPPSEKSGADPRLDQVVLNTLEKERERRTQTAEEVKTQVETIKSTGTKVLEAAPTEAPPMTTPDRPSNPGMATHIRRGMVAGLLLFFLTLAAATLVTFMMPECYVAVVRIKLEQVAPSGAAVNSVYDPYMLQTETEIIRFNGTVLSKVIEDLQLDERWGQRFGHGKLELSQVRGLLDSGMEIQPIRNTQLLEIRFFSDSPKEAAEIANAIAASYRAYNQHRLDDYLRERQTPAANPATFSPLHTLVQVEIIDQAVPPLRPIRPNKPLNIVIGGMIGLGLGLLAAVATSLVSALKSRWTLTGGEQRQSRRASNSGSTISAAPVQAKPDRFWRWCAVVGLALIAAPLAIAILGMLAAIAIPNFVKARNRAHQQHQLALLPATNSVPASAETWSPMPTPGTTPDLQKILGEAKAFMSKGAYEEALQRHIWYHNHALELEPAQSGVRLSFALGDWIELGRRYPKAKQALIEIRDNKTREIVEGRGYAEMVQEVQSINHNLQDDDATYSLFKTIRERDPQLADQCYFYLQDLLVAKGEYQWCFNHLGDPQRRFDSIRQLFDMERSRLSGVRSLPVPSMRFPTNGGSAPAPSATAPPPPTMPAIRTDLSEMMRKSAENSFIGQTCQLVEILVATGHKADAEKIRDQAIASLDDARLRSAVDDAEKKTRR